MDSISSVMYLFTKVQRHELVLRLAVRVCTWNLTLLRLFLAPSLITLRHLALSTCHNLAVPSNEAESRRELSIDQSMSLGK